MASIVEAIINNEDLAMSENKFSEAVLFILFFSLFILLVWTVQSVAN